MSAKRFNPADWETVLPRGKRRGILQSPYLEPASIVAQETGSDLEECIGCGQFREHVAVVVIGDVPADVCIDCRQECEL